MTDYERPDWNEYSEPYEAEESPYWSPARVVYLLIILITLIAFILYVIYPAIMPLHPAPTFIPRQQA